MLISAGDDSTIKCFKLPELTLIKTLRGHSGKIGEFCVFDNFEKLASIAQDNSIITWDLNTS